MTPIQIQIQILNRATDPMLPLVKPHTFATLRLLDQQEITNHVLVITRYRVEPADCALLNDVRNLKLTILVTHSGIDHPRIEPVDWRPIVPGLNDSNTHLGRAHELSHHAHATVFTGLFFRNEIRDYYRAHGIPEPYPYTARRKVFPADLEQRILTAFAGADVETQVAAALSDRILVAHNATVEHGVLRAHLPCWQPTVVLDTLRLARHVWPGLASYGPDHLTQHLALTNDIDGHRHRATYDAQLTWRLLKTALKVGSMTWNDLLDAAALPNVTALEDGLW